MYFNGLLKHNSQLTSTLGVGYTATVVVLPDAGNNTYGGSRGDSMGSVEPPFLPQIHPESPENGMSEYPDFKIFWGSMPPDPSSLWHSQI